MFSSAKVRGLGTRGAGLGGSCKFRQFSVIQHLTISIEICSYLRQVIVCHSRGVCLRPMDLLELRKMPELSFEPFHSVTLVRCRALNGRFYTLPSYQAYYGRKDGRQIFYERVLAELLGPLVHSGLKTLTRKRGARQRLSKWVHDNFNYGGSIMDHNEVAILWVVYLLLQTDSLSAEKEYNVNLAIILLSWWANDYGAELDKHLNLQAQCKYAQLCVLLFRQVRA